MIDTVRLKVFGSWKSDSLPSGWHVKEGGSMETDTGRTHHYRAVCHEDTGFRVSGNSSDATACEVSLPRILHGSNGSLLKSEEEVMESLRLVSDRLHSVVTPLPGFEPTLTRLDAAWNCDIDGGVRSVIRAVENARHSNVRRSTVVYKNESIHWPGANCRIRIYDKGKELTGKESNVVRFEAQFRGKHVAPFNEDARGMGMRAYQALRDTVCKLQAIDEPRLSKMADLLAYMEQDGVRDSKGRDLVSIFLSGMEPRTRYRWMASIRKARIHHAKIVFTQLFPVDHLPPVVEIAA